MNAPTQAQPTVPTHAARRLEIAAAPSERRVEVLPIAADSSILVYSDFRQRHEGDATKHQFEAYDAQLRHLWTTAVHLPAGAEVRALTADGAVPYALCTSEANLRLLLIIRFAPGTGSGQVFRYELPVAVAPLAFEVSGEAFVVATAYRQQTVLRLPLRDSAAVQFLPVMSSPVTSIADALPEPGGLAVLAAERIDETTRLLLRPFQIEIATNLPALRILQSPHPATLTSGRLTPVAASTQPRLVVGTYATRDPRLAQGIFSTVLPPLPESGEPPAPTLLYYDLPTLPHYYDRFGPRRRARAMNRARRRRTEGLETTARAHLLLHRPLALPDGGHALVAEQYYPRYRGGDAWSYRSLNSGLYPNLRGFSYGLPGFYGSYDPVNVWDRGLDGYVFTQAMVFVFDPTGRLRWQNTFVLNNLTRPDLKAVVAATVLPTGAVALAAPSDNGERIRQLTLSGNAAPGTPDAPTEAELRAALAPHERLLDARDTQVLTWRPGHLLLTGYQRLRAAGQREREVFVIATLP